LEQATTKSNDCEKSMNLMEAQYKDNLADSKEHIKMLEQELDSLKYSFNSQKLCQPKVMIFYKLC